MLRLNGKIIPTGRFPNQESYVNTFGLKDMLVPGVQMIQMVFENNNDLMNLLFLKGTLDDMGVEMVSLFAPFFPYSTMDHSDGSKSLSLRYVAHMINSMHFRRVYIAEPHSSVVMALVDRVQQVGVLDRLVCKAMNAVPDRDKVVFCFPDLGAAKRYAGRIGGEYRTLTFEKDRDFATGKINGMRCVDPIPQDAASFIILDDLCRRGGTFMMCADLLRKAGAKNVFLCVVHMEAGAFTGILAEDSPVDRVFTTDSCLFSGASEKLDVTEWQASNIVRTPADSLTECRLVF